MPVIPVHYFVYHPQGKLKGTNPPGGPGTLMTDAKAEYPYMIACQGPDVDQLRKSISTEPGCVTCEKCKATDEFKANFNEIAPLEEAANDNI